MNDRKVLLTDVDGCLVDWFSSFKTFAENKLGRQFHGLPSKFYLFEYLGISEDEARALVHEFNGFCPEFSRIPPCRKAEIYLPMIKEMGYDIIAVSACSGNDNTVRMRTNNLKDVFGDIISEIHCVGTIPAKKRILERHEGTFWVEDNVEPSRIGADLGHKSLILRYLYNTHMENDHPDITWVDDWSTIIKIIEDSI